MSEFQDYVSAGGGCDAEQAAAADRIGCWNDLYDWLDERPDRRQPAFQRRPIAPASFRLRWRDNLSAAADPDAASEFRRAPRGWKKVVEYRLRIVLCLALLPTCFAFYVSYNTLMLQGASAATILIYLCLYGLPVYLLSQNFLKTMLGTLYLLRGEKGNPWHPAQTARDPRPETKVAVLYPVYHENVARVAAGLAATRESIGQAYPEFSHHFDFFLLSDSQKAEYWLAEEAAVRQLNKAFPGYSVRYRRRTMNINAKMGNIVDFCRRWGSDYDYLLVMDADSVMSGETCLDLLRMMEGNERLGILQTNPKPVLRTSLFGRMMQFGARLFGTFFTYSLQVMYMGNSVYIGHNALVRTRAFMQHCILPTLSGPKPWGGKPLSHDIVEGALITRAGYEVWFLPELEGSYEEMPANILGHLVRERRWMQGNLQHIRFLFLRGVPSLYREIFLSGSMNYAAAPIYAAFLAISILVMLNFFESGGTFQNMDEVRIPALVLVAAMATFLVLARVISLAVHLRRDKAVGYGGKGKLALSTLFEFMLSLAYMPMLMINITYFFWLWIRRKVLSWSEQDRGDSELSWPTCFTRFGWISLLGISATAFITYQLVNAPPNTLLIIKLLSGGWATPLHMVLGFSPMLAGWSLAVVIARITSKSFPAIRRARLFCIPEELDVPPVLQATKDWERRFASVIPNAADRDATIDYALTDLRFYMEHRAVTRRRPRVAERLLPKIANREPLGSKELVLAMSERSCFDLLHQQCVEMRSGARVAAA
jgi:membrane glycosyltransferase